MSKKRIVGWFAFVILVLVVLGLAFTNRYNLYDWVRLRNYQPSSAIAALATDGGMNDYGRRLFYVNDPQLSDRDKFNTECTSSEQTIVLGCFTGTNIYVFNVDDTKLNGVKEVTAAHEMLHAAYQRLSAADKKHVNELLETAYKQVNDSHLTEIMAGYEKSEPGERDNELHSILGTEYANLSPELDAYYKRYFTDRSKVVAYANSYKKVFEDIQSQVSSYDADLALRKREISDNQTSLQQQAVELQAQKQQMESQLQSGQTAAYNAQVASYNTRVNSYNALATITHQRINEYNQIVEKRNALALQQQNLAQSLDSHVSTIDK